PRRRCRREGRDLRDHRPAGRRRRRCAVHLLRTRGAARDRRPYPGDEPGRDRWRVRACGFRPGTYPGRGLPRIRGGGVSGAWRDRLIGFLLRNATAIIFIVVFLYFGVSADNFFGADNSINIVKQASFVGLLAVGMTFVLLTAGIDLSVGSNMYVSAMAVGYLLQLPGMDGGFGVFAGMAVGLATGAAFGAINAICVVFLRITPFLVTLATM